MKLTLLEQRYVVVVGCRLHGNDVVQIGNDVSMCGGVGITGCNSCAEKKKKNFDKAIRASQMFPPIESYSNRHLD